MVKTVFSLEQVSLSYGSKEVLRSLSFCISVGEFIGVLGPNGCGKTTLLNLLAGTLRPSRGRISLFERDLEKHSRRETARLVSVLPQETFVDFPFTALEVVLMGRSPYLKNFQWEGPRDLEIAHEAMRATDCLAFAERDIRSLSGGERERVLLARALAQEPQVLLLDEPTTHLDLEHQGETYRLLQALHREKQLTLLVVLHDLNFAANACGRVLLLSGGELKADGPPELVMTEARLREVFHTEVVRGIHPQTGKSCYLPEWR
ncbi:MAG TPA: ABC transporter [Deltaproteobacteria bacterium]|nr:ABC transporter [Deltaproteobacteria bacterium]